MLNRPPVDLGSISSKDEFLGDRSGTELWIEQNASKAISLDIT